MSGAAQLVLMVGGLHLLGLICAVGLILPALRDQPEPPPPPQGGPGGGGGLRPAGTPPKASPKGGLPLPDAKPARVRLREPGRLTEHLPRRPRRPAREPDRAPVREPR